MGLRRAGCGVGGGVLGLSPVVPEPSGLTPLTVNVAGVDYPAIRFSWRKAATDVTTQVQIATDLGFGTLLGSAQVSATAGPAGMEIVTVRSTTPESTAARQFIRLRRTPP